MDRTAYERHYDLDCRHFWRIGKRRLVLEWLGHNLPKGESLKILDIGGACSVISCELEMFGEVTVVEPDEGSVFLAREKLGINIQQGRLPDELGVSGPFDVIVLLDVLEHVEDDLKSLETIRDLLTPGGILICTVPAYPWLWSQHDVSLHHFRRYTCKSLCRRFGEAGLRVKRRSYYTSLLLPLVVVQRVLKRLLGNKQSTEYKVRVPNGVVNRVLGSVMSLERGLLRLVDLPVGSSLIAVCGRGGK